MQIESRTTDRLVFAPRDRRSRIRSLVGGMGFLLIGLLSFVQVILISLDAIPTRDSHSLLWLAPLFVGVVFVWAGLKYILQSLPLRLEVTRAPLGSCIFFRSWAFARVRLPQIDAVVVGTRRGRRGSRYYVLSFRQGCRTHRAFQSFEYWWSDEDAIRRAVPMTQAISDFLECPVEAASAVATGRSPS